MLEPRSCREEADVMDQHAVYCCLDDDDDDDDDMETSAAAAAAAAAAAVGKLEKNGARRREVIAGVYTELEVRGKPVPTKHRGITGDGIKYISK